MMMKIANLSCNQIVGNEQPVTSGFNQPSLNFYSLSSLIKTHPRNYLESRFKFCLNFFNLDFLFTHTLVIKKIICYAFSYDNGLPMRWTLLLFPPSSSP